MSEAAKHITIRRERGFFAIFRKLIIDIDGVETLRLKAGEARSVALAPHASRLLMRLGWQQSEPFSLDPVKNADMLVIYIIPRTFHEMRTSKVIPFGIRIEQG